MSAAEATPELPEPRLVERAVAGDKNALVVLFYRHYDRLAADLCHKLPAGGREQVAVEDVLQQVFLRAFQKIDTFQYRGPQGFFYWLKTIADNICTDELRKRQLRRERGDYWPEAPAGEDSGPPHPAGPVDEETPSRLARRRERAGALHAALAALHPRQRDAVSLVFLQDLSLDEAAARMQTTRAAVHSLVYRGLERLEQILGPMSDYLSRP